MPQVLPEHDETAELIRRWRESERRSRDRRAAPPRRRSTACLLLYAAAIGAAGLWVRGEEPVSTPGRSAAQAQSILPAQVSTSTSAHEEPAIPRAAAITAAWRFARRRGGDVSIAVIDTRGRLHGRAARRRYPSASVVKAMLLVAELRRLARNGLELDDGTLSLLRAMIARSDNDAADVIYARVGGTGLRQVAKAAGLRDFTVAGSWGYAQITAADMAILFTRVRQLVPRPHRRAALGLLRSLDPEFRWGIVRAARGRWTVYAKGGWRETASGRLVHQAAWLRDGPRTLAIAVLTDAQPPHIYGVHTVRGVADRLLAP